MKIKKLQPKKFSEHFKLSNEEFDFVDIYAYQDIPLFLDPYGISVVGNTWSKDCEAQIATYFQLLINSITSGNRKMTEQLLNALHEVDEIALGYSASEPRGRGIGRVQAKEIQQAFENSEAAKSGDIKDIADCALLIPGINRDKISDITANILKRQLIAFTQEQCKKYNIPMQRVPISNAFDFTQLEFASYFAQLPIINGKPKILLPITAVRRSPELSKDKFYRNFVLEFLRAEHQHAGDALTTLLKNGRIVVRIKDLKAKYPIGENFLYKFSKEHPEILNKYKSELKRTAVNVNLKPRLVTKEQVLNAVAREQFVRQIQLGTKDASSFHKMSVDNIIHVFGDRLKNPKIEQKLNEGRKRVDVVFDNNGERSGFFNSLNAMYHVYCPKIFIECKNYSTDIGNPEFDQLAGRFSTRRGKFGMIFCRSIKDKAAVIQRCKDVLNEKGEYILVLQDQDVFSLLKYRENGDEQGIDNFMLGKLNEIIM